MAAEQDLIDWAQLRELRSEIGPEDFAEVVAVFLSDADTLIDAIAGAGADGMEEALHAMKGSALNIGLTELARLCAEGESLAAQGRAEEVAVAPVLTCFARSRAALERGLAEGTLDEG